ncbi:beta-galactosidase-like isoform X2 [Argopecten irradians]|uniref:beta-galactosidase-like isoform X2 n=1 Tax=Argopecten irradians TaxID=31199 RepID=UPI00371AB1FF
MVATTGWSILLLLSVGVCCCQLVLSQTPVRNFTIDYDGNTFLKDGKPFRYVSGSIHYSRVPQDYWLDRLLKMYAAGLNAIQVYIPWNIHQTKKGDVYDFTGQQDFVQFIRMAGDVGLLVILRPGPFICAEWDFGGIPAWILKENPKTVFRSMDATYIKFVDQWFDVLMPMVKPLLYINGGPIITVQVENEYGSYFACDHTYTEHLRDKVISHLGKDVVLFTTDNAIDPFIKCGKIPGVYSTIDFGITELEKPTEKFKHQRKFEPKGPLVNSEYYTGWLDYWGAKHQVRSTEKVAKDLDELLSYGANVNMYMFEGGTNFGYWNGANYFVFPLFDPVPTSYDYDAPLTEAGDVTQKYHTIRQVISKYNTLPDIPIPAPSPKAKYGTVPMKFLGTVQDLLPYLSPTGGIKSTFPPTMEAIGQNQGFALYRHILKRDYKIEAILKLAGIRDRGYVMLDNSSIGIVIREKETLLLMTGKKGQVLDILVENQGHINVGRGLTENLKGFLENITLGNELLTDWIIYPVLPDNINASVIAQHNGSSSVVDPRVPSIYVGHLTISGEPLDTYLDMTGWTKGQALMEGEINLGRYWPTVGPQVRMYVPRPYLHGTSRLNTLVMFELEKAPCGSSSQCSVSFVDQPLINSTTTTFSRTLQP